MLRVCCWSLGLLFVVALLTPEAGTAADPKKGDGKKPAPQKGPAAKGKNAAATGAATGDAAKGEPAKSRPRDAGFALSSEAATEAAGKIDHLVVEALTKAGQRPNPLTTDEQFVRRAYLQIVGRIPTQEEAADFLDDKAADKRNRLMDRLLLADGHVSTMFNWLADMLRVMDDYNRGYGWQYEAWVREQLVRNRPWDELVREMLSADGRLADNGATGYLLRDRGMRLDSMSNTLTLFLGANVACAQCHDHPFAAWSQRDFYEMAAFFGATDTEYTFKVVAKANALVAAGKLERSDRGKLIKILWTNAQEVSDKSKNALKFPSDYRYEDAKPGQPVKPGFIGWAEGDEQGLAYKVDTADPAKLRDGFAAWLTHPDNPRFAAAIANRTWKRAFGLAVHEPVTDLDDPQEASNPALLAHLAAEMKRVKFNLREFQRILYRTQTWQRQASLTPDLAAGPYRFPGPLLRRMTAEQAWDSLATLVLGAKVDAYHAPRAEDVRKIRVSDPEQLKPEQAVALLKQYPDPRAALKAGKRGKGEAAGPGDAPRVGGLVLARAAELPQPAPESHFLRMFGQSDRLIADGATAEGSIPQVLMLMNGKAAEVIGAADSRIYKIVKESKSTEDAIDALYLSFFSRRPARHEVSAVKHALGQGANLHDFTWALFNSREFIFIQ